MDPRENFLKALRGERHEFVPIELYGFRHSDRESLGAVEDEFHLQIGKRIQDRLVFRTHLESYINRYCAVPPQRIRSDIERLSSGNERCLGTIDTPKGTLTFETEQDPAVGTTWTVKYPVESIAELEKLMSVPWERPENLRPIDGSERIGDFETRGISELGVSTPSVCVGGAMSYQNFLLFCATDLDIIKEATALCLERVLDVLEVTLSRPGVDLVWLGGSEWLTPPMGSPALYDALVQEQERKIIDYVRTHSDAVMQVHCHGRVGTVLEKTIERGVDYTEPVEPPPDGDVTMSNAKDLAAGRITLGGNIETRVLCNETEDVVETAVRAAFEGPNDRFVLVTTAGCSPTLAEREFRNYMRLIDVWEELSPM